MRTDKEREGERAQLHARNSKFGNFILAGCVCLCVCVCTACVCVRGHKQQLGKNNLNILAKFHILSTFHWHYPTEIASKNRSEPKRIKARRDDGLKNGGGEVVHKVGGIGSKPNFTS